MPHGVGTTRQDNGGKAQDLARCLLQFYDAWDMFRSPAGVLMVDLYAIASVLKQAGGLMPWSQEGQRLKPRSQFLFGCFSISQK